MHDRASEGPTDVLSSWPAAGRAFLGAALTLVAVALPGGAGHAQGKLEARYAVTIAGIPVGQGV